MGRDFPGDGQRVSTIVEKPAWNLDQFCDCLRLPRDCVRQLRHQVSIQAVDGLNGPHLTELEFRGFQPFQKDHCTRLATSYAVDAEGVFWFEPKNQFSFLHFRRLAVSQLSKPCSGLAAQFEPRR
jgi:hypothetical protein